MYESVLAVVVIVTMVKIADSQGDSKIIWGAVTFAVLFLCDFLIPIPYASVLIGAVLAYLLLFVMNIIRKKS